MFWATLRRPSCSEGSWMGLFCEGTSPTGPPNIKAHGGETNRMSRYTFHMPSLGHILKMPASFRMALHDVLPTCPMPAAFLVSTHGNRFNPPGTGSGSSSR